MDTDASIPTWPLWLHQLRLDEAALGQAYEATPPRYRASVKHALALIHTLWGEAPDRHRREHADAARGFYCAVEDRPAPWAVLVLGRGYAAAARLAAAIMPAVLAHVPLLGALCLAQEDASLPPSSVRVTLELAGVEEIFQTSMEEIQRLLRHMAAEHDRGRVVLLHRGDLAPLRAVAAELALPLWEEHRPPRLVAHADALADLDTDMLAFAHPDAPLSVGSSASDALYVQTAAAIKARPGAASLMLTPGMEGCWLHADLGPDFFRRRSVCAAPYPSSGGEV